MTTWQWTRTFPENEKKQKHTTSVNEMLGQNRWFQKCKTCIYLHYWCHYQWIWLRYRNILKCLLPDDLSMESPYNEWLARLYSKRALYRLDRSVSLQLCSKYVLCPFVAGIPCFLRTLCKMIAFGIFVNMFIGCSWKCLSRIYFQQKKRKCLSTYASPTYKFG